MELAFSSIYEVRKKLSVIKIFVYDTLKPGESNYKRYCTGQVVAEKRAIAYGQLFALPVGYPAMILGNSPVQGFLLEFTNPAILEILDQLEDYDPNRPATQNLYNRQEIAVFTPDKKPLGTAWIYLMTVEQVHRLRGVLLPSGCWDSSEIEAGRDRPNLPTN